MNNKHKKISSKLLVALVLSFILGVIASSFSHIAHASQLIGDVNSDGVVNISDLAIMASNWGVSSGATWAMGDLNGDGAVDIDDLAILAAQWGDTSAQLPAVPTGLSANATSSSTVSLTWDADSGSGITYIVYRDGTEITTTASTGYNDSGLTGNDTYDYTIAASNSFGISNQSNADDATTPSGFVTTSGTSLMLNGSPIQFIGFDAYGTLGDWNGSGGGAWTNAQLDTYFASLPANGLTRIFAFPQDEMENSGSNDANTVTALETELAQAAIYHQHVILVLGNDDGSANLTESDPTGAGEPLSFYQSCSGSSYCYQTEYKTWVDTVVPAIMNNSTDAPLVAMWEIANEPGDVATVPEATMATYLNTAAGYIHSAAAGTLNPNVLVETGVDDPAAMGGGQTNYTNAQSGSNINVLSYHDYPWDYETGAPLLDSNFTIAQAAAISLNKPFVTGEAGVEGCQSPSGNAENGHPFFTWAQRVTYNSTKATDYFEGTGPSGTNTAAMDSAVLFWDYVPVAGKYTACGDYYYDISPPDPMVAAVTNFQMP